MFWVDLKPVAEVSGLRSTKSNTIKLVATEPKTSAIEIYKDVSFGAAEAGDLRHFSLQVVLSEPALSLERSLAA